MKTVILGEPLIHLQSVDSTNIYATSLLHREPVKEGTVILADYQTHGKGQAGNNWISEKNSNLLFSIVLKPEFLPAERQFYLSMCISNGLTGYVKKATGLSSIKWPNDILMNQRKVAGILIENSIMGEMLHTSVIGIGLNVNQQTFPSGLHNPVSMRIATGTEYNREHVLKALLLSLQESVNQLYSGRLDMIRTCYLNNLWGMNEWKWYTDDSGRFEGRITEVSDSGELMVMHRGGEIRQYGNREITFEI